MDGVDSNHVNHPSSHGPSLDIQKILSFCLLGSTPPLLMSLLFKRILLMCCAPKYVKLVMYRIQI